MAKSSMPIVALTRLIERFKGSVNNYNTCSTAAATAAKTVAMTGFVLAAGASVKVKFTYDNTAASPTLSVNGTTAKTMQYKGANITSSTPYLLAGGVYEFVYDGTYYQLLSDDSKEPLIRIATAKITLVDTDTIPLTDSAASSATKKITWANVKAVLKTHFDTLYATIASPTFTGTPKVPSKTAAATSDGTLIATEAQVALKANTASPAFTGTPTAPDSTDYSTSRIRNISMGTADLTPGTSALASGALYFVYE